MITFRWFAIALVILVGVPQLTEAQCYPARLTGKADSSAKFRLKIDGFTVPSWAAFDPVSNGVTVTLHGAGSTVFAIDPGVFAGGGTKGWVAKPGQFKYLDATGASSKFKILIRGDDSNVVRADVKAFGQDSSILNGVINDDTAVQASFDSGGDGCTTAFVNEIPNPLPPNYKPVGEDCFWTPTMNPKIIKCVDK
jgi:hypothetical protein